MQYLGAIAMTKKPTYNSKSKHIDVKYHFVREMGEVGVVKLTN
jgi:hypothetical protein